MKPATVIQHPIHGIGIVNYDILVQDKTFCLFGGETRRLEIAVKNSELKAVDPIDLSPDQATDVIYLMQWKIVQLVEDSNIF